jgi:hypothetical protein
VNCCAILWPHSELMPCYSYLPLIPPRISYCLDTRSKIQNGVSCSNGNQVLDIVQSLATRAQSCRLHCSLNVSCCALLWPNSELCLKPDYHCCTRRHFESSILYPGNRICEEVSGAGNCSKALVQSVATR